MTTAGAASTPPAGRSESQAEKILRLEAELVVSRTDQVQLETERDILRQAAKYYAAETNW